jgi:phosphoglycerate dehydrogenase-like enzyme
MFWPFKKNRTGKVRLGIIGMGNIGKQHADYLLAGRVSRDWKSNLTAFGMKVILSV